MRRQILAALLLATTIVNRDGQASALTYAIVDTGQEACYGNAGRIAPPRSGEPFHGQDAQHHGNQPAYRDNGDGTVTDLTTGLTWVQARGAKVSWAEAMAGAAACRVGGHTDWRMPTIKELYSLIDFRGYQARSSSASRPYIDRSHFEFRYGNEAAGERAIDCQDWSATRYAGTTMGGSATAFGVNFADGRIKGYPIADPRGGAKRLFVRYVRGNPAYGRSRFVDHADGTIADAATGLTWTKADSGRGLNWQEALAWVAELNASRHLGHDDWRLPNAKELQSIVDYTRAPDAADPSRRGPALDPVFSITRLAGGEYPHFWSSTTHVENQFGVYVCFGRALGFLRGRWMDVHGAGAQRSDPKSGSAAAYPRGLGPQGDEIRVLNFVRPVRG